MEFPLFKTKIKGLTKKFNLTDPVDRQRYFEAKAGEEIEKLKTYFERDSFIAYLLAKKSAGKGTYAGLLQEIFGPERIAHISVGDIVRRVDEEIKDPQKKKELEDFMRAHYRGFQSMEEIFQAQKNRDTKGLAHSAETILVLLEREISRLGKKTLLIDGFPRNLDQVSYSLFYRTLVGYRDDPDLFILINVPEVVIDERMKNRVICPKCRLSRNLKLLRTQMIDYDRENDTFFLKCENPACQGERMVGKEGDELGIEAIRSRLNQDGELMAKAFSLYGIPKILLRNSVPVNLAKILVDDYEITPAYSYSWDEGKKAVRVTEVPWIIKDDQGTESYSLLAPAVVVPLIKELVKALRL